MRPPRESAAQKRRTEKRQKGRMFEKKRNNRARDLSLDSILLDYLKGSARFVRCASLSLSTISPSDTHTEHRVARAAGDVRLLQSNRPESLETFVYRRRILSQPFPFGIFYSFLETGGGRADE